MLALSWDAMQTLLKYITNSIELLIFFKSIAEIESIRSGKL